MLQTDIIEDIKDERFAIEENWINPLFIETQLKKKTGN
jgi:hypothetical protein